MNTEKVEEMVETYLNGNISEDYKTFFIYYSIIYKQFQNQFCREY